MLEAASLSKMGYLISGLGAVLRSVINQNNTVNQIVKHSIFHDVLMFYNSSDQLMAPSVVMPILVLQFVPIGVIIRSGTKVKMLCISLIHGSPSKYN